MTHKAIILIGDGLGDRPIQALNGLTPLEAARTPNLDKMAAAGITGLLDPIAAGIRAGSDTAHLALLGYDPYKYYTGRGPFECMGVGLDVRGGDLAFRCNFSTVDDKRIVIDRRAGRIESGTDALAASLNGMALPGGITAFFKESTAHRAALVLRGAGLSDKISDSIDPHQDGLPYGVAKPLSDDAKIAADAINAFVSESYRILSTHPVNLKRVAEGLLPANIALPRGAGMTPHVPAFEQRWGFSGGAVVEVGLIRGIARYLGLTLYDAPGSTGGSDTDEASMAHTTIQALDDHPFILINLKGPDLGGHDGDFRLKIAMIEKLDNLAGILTAETGEDIYIAVLGDHSTPCMVKDHSGDPVPILIYGTGVRKDNVTTFGERPCSQGGLGHLRGLDLMNMVTQLMETQEKYGA